MTVTEAGALSVPSVVDRVAEQGPIQDLKIRDRAFLDYDECIFPNTVVTYRKQWAVAKVLRGSAWRRALLPNAQFQLREVLKDMVGGLGENERAHWVDLGTGKGVAQQEILEKGRCYPRSWEAKIDVTGVDLLKYPVGIGFLAQFYGREPKGGKPPRGFTRPHFIQADAAEVQLPKPADIITSVFSIPYWYDPMRGIVNAYNQLKPNGLLFVAANAKYEWTRGVRYMADRGVADRSPIEDLERSLSAAGVQYAGLSTRPAALGGEYEYEGDPTGEQYYSLIMRRSPGTELRLRGIHAGVTKYPSGTKRHDSNYKIAWYVPPADDIPFVDIAQVA